MIDLEIIKLAMRLRSDAANNENGLRGRERCISS